MSVASKGETTIKITWFRHETKTSLRVFFMTLFLSRHSRSVMLAKYTCLMCLRVLMLLSCNVSIMSLYRVGLSSLYYTHRGCFDYHLVPLICVSGWRWWCRVSPSKWRISLGYTESACLYGSLVFLCHLTSHSNIDFVVYTSWNISMQSWEILEMCIPALITGNMTAGHT